MLVSDVLGRVVGEGRGVVPLERIEDENPRNEAPQARIFILTCFAKASVPDGFVHVGLEFPV